MRNATLALLMLAAPVAAEETAMDADVWFYGEVHDNPAHHDNQAQWVSELAPSAIVFEMLDRDEAALVMAERAAGRFDTLEQTLNWAESGWPDWAMYAQIIAAAPDAVVIGGEVPRDLARAAFGGGAAAAFGDDAPRFGLDKALSEDQQVVREEMQFVAHCEAVPRDILPGFVEAQRLRDARLAEAVIEALEAYGPPVAVITGNGHARADWGAPALLMLAQPGLAIMTVGQFEDTPDEDAPYDRIVVTAPAEREDPCAAFQ